MSLPTTGPGLPVPIQNPAGTGTNPIQNPVGTGQIPIPDPNDPFINPFGFLEPGAMFMKPGEIPADQMTDYPGLHPNSLVAITTARIVNKQPGDAIRDDPTLTALVQPQNRFILVLDALAALGISEENSQIVAVGAKIDGTRVSMTLAENTKDPAKGKKVEHHLQDLINMLHRYSALSTAQEISDQELAIFKATYSASIIPMVKRFTKYAWLARLETAMEVDVGTTAYNCRNVISAVLTLSQALSDIVKGGVNAVNNAQWQEIVFMMSGAIPCVEFLHNEAGSCNQFAVNHQGITSIQRSTTASLLLAID